MKIADKINSFLHAFFAFCTFGLCMSSFGYANTPKATDEAKEAYFFIKNFPMESVWKFAEQEVLKQDPTLDLDSALGDAKVTNAVFAFYLKQFTALQTGISLERKPIMALINEMKLVEEMNRLSIKYTTPLENDPTRTLCQSELEDYIGATGESGIVYIDTLLREYINVLDPLF